MTAKKVGTTFSFVVTVQVKPTALAGLESVRKHVRGQVQMGSACLHGCHIRKVMVVPTS